MFWAIKILTVQKHLNKCKSYLQNKTDLLLIGTWLWFSSTRILTKYDLKFHKVCRDIIQVRWKMLAVLSSKIIQDATYQLLSESDEVHRWGTGLLADNRRLTIGMTNKFWPTFFLDTMYSVHLIYWATTTLATCIEFTKHKLLGM